MFLLADLLVSALLATARLAMTLLGLAAVLAVVTR
jgi:hypothetical protein